MKHTELTIDGETYQYRFMKKYKECYWIRLKDSTFPFDENTIGKVYKFKRWNGSTVWWAEGKKGNVRWSYPGKTRKIATAGFLEYYLTAPSAEEDV